MNDSCYKIALKVNNIKNSQVKEQIKNLKHIVTKKGVLNKYRKYKNFSFYNCSVVEYYDLLKYEEWLNSE